MEEPNEIIPYLYFWGARLAWARNITAHPDWENAILNNMALAPSGGNNAIDRCMEYLHRVLNGQISPRLFLVTLSSIRDQLGAELVQQALRYSELFNFTQLLPTHRTFFFVFTPQARSAAQTAIYWLQPRFPQTETTTLESGISLTRCTNAAATRSAIFIQLAHGAEQQFVQVVGKIPNLVIIHQSTMRETYFHYPNNLAPARGLDFITGQGFYAPHVTQHLPAQLLNEVNVLLGTLGHSAHTAAAIVLSDHDTDCILTSMLERLIWTPLPIFPLQDTTFVQLQFNNSVALLMTHHRAQFNECLMFGNNQGAVVFIPKSTFDCWSDIMTENQQRERFFKLHLSLTSVKATSVQKWGELHSQLMPEEQRMLKLDDSMQSVTVDPLDIPVPANIVPNTLVVQQVTPVLWVADCQRVDTKDLNNTEKQNKFLQDIKACNQIQQGSITLRQDSKYWFATNSLRDMTLHNQQTKSLPLTSSGFLNGHRIYQHCFRKEGHYYLMLEGKSFQITVLLKHEYDDLFHRPVNNIVLLMPPTQVFPDLHQYIVAYLTVSAGFTAPNPSNQSILVKGRDQVVIFPHNGDVVRQATLFSNFTTTAVIFQYSGPVAEEFKYACSGRQFSSILGQMRGLRTIEFELYNVELAVIMQKIESFFENLQQ